MIEVVRFDFGRKEEARVQPQEVTANPGKDIYYWINLDREGIGELIPVMNRLCSQTPVEPEDFLKPIDELLEVRTDFIGFNLVETWLVDNILQSRPIRIMLGDCYMVTLCERSKVMAQVKGN